MEKGDSCRLIWKYNNALNYYQQAYDHPEVADDVDMQFQLLERIMRTHDVLRLLNDRGDIYMRMGEYERAAECYSRTSAIADTLSVHSLSNLTVEVQKVIDSERTIAKHREWQIIIIAGIIILVVFILLMLRQNLIVRRKNKRMMALIRQLTSYREAIIQNGDSDEMGENLVSGVSAEEYKRFKEVDKRIMKEQLFSNPDFGRDDLMPSEYRKQLENGFTAPPQY